MQLAKVAAKEAAPEGIHALPGGTRTGNCVHEIFEELEFTDDKAIDPLVKSKLQAFSFPADLPAPSGMRVVTNANAAILEPHFRSWLPDVETCQLAEKRHLLREVK